MNKTKNQRFLACPNRHSYLNKRASHVGVVLSFVIFITFIIFLYSITEPATNIDRGKQDLLNFLKIELVKDFSADLTEETIVIDKNIQDDCVRIDTEDDNLVSVAVDEETGEVLESYFDGDKVEIKRGDSNDIKVYYSKEFSNGESISGCVDIGEDDYNLGLVRTTENIFESKIINFSGFIDNSQGYEEIKQKYKMATGDEFGFIFEDGERNVIVETKEKEVSTDIFVEEIAIQYVDNEAHIKPGFLKIKVW